MRRQYMILKISFFWLLINSSFAGAQVLNDPALQLREVVSGLSQPTAMAFIGKGDILVLQKADGRVRRVINGVLQPGQVLDVAVDSSSERGLLGIAIHPNFPNSPFVYLYYTESSNGSDTSGLSCAVGESSLPLYLERQRIGWPANSF